jgi:hypothetical protein
LGAMADILEFTGFRVARPHRPGRRRPFQRLDASFFISTEDVNALFLESRGIRVELTERSNRVVKLIWIVGTVVIQPIAAAVRLQVSPFLKSAPPCGKRCRGRRHVGRLRLPVPAVSRV